METATQTQGQTTEQTPMLQLEQPRQKTRQEILAEGLPGIIRALPEVEDKARCMTWLGDARYAQFRETGNRNYLRLAKNCYNAARNFHGR